MFAITTLIVANCLYGSALSAIVETHPLSHGPSIRQAPNTSDAQTQVTDMHIAFDLPDITATIQLQSGSVQLEGFKYVSNDKIDMAGKETSQLAWVSIGHPHLIKTEDPENQGDFKYFHSSSGGFTTYVQMMTAEQGAALATAARNKYQVDIADGQVGHLILSKFYCNKLLYDETGNRYLLSGTTSDFMNFPLRMDFDIPLGKIERILFSNMIKESEDLSFECHIESGGGKLIKSNTLSISYGQSQQIGLEEKLFGPAGNNALNEVYVSRNQMFELAHEMYSTLNIIDEYQMPESQFSEEFVKDFISQVATSPFRQVPLETALATISKYRFDFDTDLRPFIIKNDIDSFLSFSREATTDNKVVPKYLNVARIMRSKMKNSLTFKRIRFQKFDAPFERNFEMRTSRSSQFLDPNISTAKERYEEMLESISHDVLYLMNASTELNIQSQKIDKIQNDLMRQSKKIDGIQKQLHRKANVSAEVNLALRRPTKQSSTFLRYGASKAVDGNYNSNLDSSSCAHTNDRPGGPNWWRVKLDRPYRVQKVTVTNRKDCCGETRLHYFIVGVTNSTADPVRGTYPLCGQYPSEVAPGATVTLYCDPDISAGQYVIIQQPVDGGGYLTLCEVEVYGETTRNNLMIQAHDMANIQKDLMSYSKKTDSIQKQLHDKDSKTETVKILSRFFKEKSRKVVTAAVSSEENLALKRPTTQSSTMWDYAASRAVDGNKATSFSQSSCSHTNDDPGEPNWWRVQLDRPYRVQKVTVTNRGDSSANRLDYFIVGLTNSTEDPVIGTYPLCGQYPSTVARGTTVTLNCDPDISAGQYVIVQQPSNGTGWLTLCEVEVYGEPANVSSEENLALGRPATQSSDLSHNVYGVCYASRAVDGNKRTDFESLSCSHTDDDPGEPNWWRVQLDRPYRVQKVIVTNRKDCCADRLDYFIVGVTNSTEDPVIGTYPLCGQYPSTVAPGATVTLNCDPDISAGVYVIIQQPSNGTGSLTLCEVEVFAGTELEPTEI